MNRLFIALVSVSALVTAAPAGAVTNVTGFGSNNWYSDDTRADGTGTFTAGTNLVGISNTNLATGAPGEPVAGVAGHDADIAGQITFGAAPAGAPAALTSAAGTIAEYSWYGDGTPTVTASLKLGLKTSDFGLVGGLSSRTGEDVWDKVLIYEPGQANGATSDSTWQTETITATSGNWWIFDRVSLTSTQGTPQTLADIVANDVFGLGTLLGTAQITSVQFGIGSSNAGGSVYVDQLFLPAFSGDVIDFGVTAGTGDALHLTIAAGVTSGKSQVSNIDFDGHFTGADLLGGSAVPEPMTAGLGMMGLAALGLATRRRSLA